MSDCLFYTITYVLTRIWYGDFMCSMLLIRFYSQQICFFFCWVCSEIDFSLSKFFKISLLKTVKWIRFCLSFLSVYIFLSLFFIFFFYFPPQNNIGSTINLLNMMDKYNCRSIVFSSSATVSATRTPRNYSPSVLSWYFFWENLCDSIISFERSTNLYYYSKK